MSFEKEKRNNLIVMITGAILSLLGISLYFIDYKLAGVLVLVLGISLLMISWSISNFFFRVRMKEELQDRRSKR